MAKQLQLRRGTTSEHTTFTGAIGEITVDTTKDTIVVHDGTTTGGKPLATESNLEALSTTVSTDLADGLATKQDTLVSGTNIKTVNGETVLGSGDIQVTASTPIGKSAMLSGTASVTNTTLMAGFGTKLYTGNGSTQSIDAGIDLATQWGDTANETYGGLVWIKDRDSTGWHRLFDTIRGVGNTIWTNSTGIETFNANEVTAFTSSGFNGGSNLNTTTNDFASWIFQTTHRITGTTNHGKNYTCHYNPITGFTMVKYEGSGLAGHEIPHHLGRELGFATVKKTSAVQDWFAGYTKGKRLRLNLTNAEDTYANSFQSMNDTNTTLSTDDIMNASGGSYILYGWANSYYDDAGELNGNYEVGIYQGTGASGNKITTRGKPAWLMVKRLDSTGNWRIFNNQMGEYSLYPNLANAENTGYTGNDLDINEDGFTFNSTGVDINTSGGQYLYMVVYGESTGKSNFLMPSESSNFTLNDCVISTSNGVGSNGVNNTITNLGSFTISPTGGWDV